MGDQASEGPLDRLPVRIHEVRQVPQFEWPEGQSLQVLPHEAKDLTIPRGQPGIPVQVVQGIGGHGHGGDPADSRRETSCDFSWDPTLVFGGLSGVRVGFVARGAGVSQSEAGEAG